MAYTIEVKLNDAAGKAPEGGGTWQVIIRRNGAVVHDTAALNYTGAVLSVAAPIGADWTHATVKIVPNLYALQGVMVHRSSTGIYRNNASAKVTVAGADRLKIELPVLRIRESPGLALSTNPRPGNDPRAVLLEKVQGRSTNVYRELLVTEWRKARWVHSLIDSTSGPIGDPDAKDAAAGTVDSPWNRFKTRRRLSEPESAGAPLLLEYGEVGSATGKGAIFLVGIWAPDRSNAAGGRTPPAWRDIVAFLHPSTAKTWYPVSPFPFTKDYPYGVSENTPVPPGDPDRIFQPYVNLAMKYVFGIWSQFHLAGRETVFVSPILPHPVPKPSEDGEYGLPFRTQSGLARLLAEVNLYLHQIRYGWSGTNIDAWWGVAAPSAAMRFSPADNVHSFLNEDASPPLRHVAVAAFSASSTQLDTLFSTADLLHPRYPAPRWAMAETNPLQSKWIETWVTDLILGSTTVAAASLERKLLDWFSRSDARRFLITNSGTTGGSDPGALYPKLRAAAAATKRHSSKDVAKFAEVWRGENERWMGLFCSNPFLKGPSAVDDPWPPFPMTSDPDEAHGFMYALSIGLTIGWSRLGYP